VIPGGFIATWDKMKFRRQSMEKELTTIMWTRMAAEGMKDFGNEIAGQE
jgi:hypothetical protein